MDQDIDDPIPVAFAGSKVGTCRSEFGSLQCEFTRAVLLPEEWFSQTTESCSDFVLSYFDEVKLRQALGIAAADSFAFLRRTIACLFDQSLE